VGWRTIEADASRSPWYGCAMPLSDQVVLITGCSSGIGQALARELHARGQRVFASARRLASLAPLACEKVALDVTDPGSIAGAVAEVMAAAGRIDMLINNAGFNLVGPLAEVPLEGVRRMLETNVTGLLAVTQAVFPHLAAQRRGRIVNVGSVVGLLPTPFAGPYCASKAAVHMLSEVLRMECAPFGVDVIVVQPGGVRSSIADTAAEGLERYARESSLYRDVHPYIVKRARASQDRPMPTEQFAARVADAILAERAPRHVRAGRGARTLPVLSRLPGPLVDRAMSQRFGLAELSKRADPSKAGLRSSE
jgi:NAD(P)-dependent dehydrogenase (short-subunit alcohol dehydrogenase family)